MTEARQNPDEGQNRRAERIKIVAWSVATLLVIPAFSPPCSAQELETHRHPALDFAIDAPSRWQRVQHPEDALIYEITDPDRSTHVMLWYTDTQQGPLGYLKKMADMKGLAWEGEPLGIPLGGDGAWEIEGNVDVWGMDARVFLRVIPHGFSPRHPDHNALYIVMAWCPNEEATNQRTHLLRILDSVRVGD